MTMDRRHAVCCCDPVSAPNCRAFQIDCFNTTDHAAFPDYCRVTGASQYESFGYFFSTQGDVNCDPQYGLACPLSSTVKILTSFDIVLRKRPAGPPSGAPGGFGLCGWTGSAEDRACWEGVGGTYKQSVFERQWQLCDYNPNHPSFGCGCQGPNSPQNQCRWPRLLYKDISIVRTGECEGGVTCTQLGICAGGTSTYALIYGHRAGVSSRNVEESYTETTYEPFCNFCRPSTLPPNSCVYRNRGPGGDSTMQGKVPSCAGPFISERLQCSSGVPFDPEFNAPRGFVGPAEMGSRKEYDACGRLRIKSAATGSITFL